MLQHLIAPSDLFVGQWYSLTCAVLQAWLEVEAEQSS